MNCNVILDLLPLYIDDSCSAESRELVEVHLKECENCRMVLEEMRQSFVEEQEVPVTLPVMSKVERFRASLLQSILLYLSFAGIIVGVALEAATPSGIENGLWAMTVIVPTTGFMLALANWYFARLYRNRRCFSLTSGVLCVFFTLCGYLWAGLHYGCELFIDFPKYAGGILLSIVLANVAGVLSHRYGVLLGKE